MIAVSDRKRKALEAVAYHEAGHAVAAMRYGHEFQHVTIEPDHEQGSAGHVMPGRRPEGIHPDADIDPETLVWVEETIIELLAGPEAERKFMGRRNNVGAGGDLEQFFELAGYMHDGIVLDKYLAYMRARAEAFVARPVVWREIEALAAALMERKTLSHDEAKGVIRGLDVVPAISPAVLKRIADSARPAPIR